MTTINRSTARKTSNNAARMAQPLTWFGSMGMCCYWALTAQPSWTPHRASVIAAKSKASGAYIQSNALGLRPRRQHKGSPMTLEQKAALLEAALIEIADNLPRHCRRDGRAMGRRPMTSEEFKRARMALGFTQGGLAAEWGMGENGGRSIRRWECGQRPVSPIAAYAIQIMRIPRIGQADDTIGF